VSFSSTCFKFSAKPPLIVELLAEEELTFEPFWNSLGSATLEPAPTAAGESNRYLIFSAYA